MTADRAALVEMVADLVRFNHDPVAIANEAIALIRAEVLEEAALRDQELEHLGQIGQLSEELKRLEAALREIAKHPRGGVIDTPEKMDRDEFIGIARAALEGKGDE